MIAKGPIVISEGAARSAISALPRPWRAQMTATVKPPVA
ncbi:hypothetical protein BOSEA31B_10626 [Hyphomicrobiales bacterium]|nr:hypothetical protein BOSEA31B_10626 [Hyphomicrobiales bacterium]